MPLHRKETTEGPPLQAMRAGHITCVPKDYYVVSSELSTREPISGSIQQLPSCMNIDNRKESGILSIT